MPTRTEAIKSFLLAFAPKDFAELYNHDMECQVNVAQDGGTLVEDEYRGRMWRGWTDGQTTWKSFRIPRNADSDPEFDDTRMSFDLTHAEGIGMTGWNWKTRESHWVAFDFDAILGHKSAHERKMTESELEHVKNLASEIPWVTVRKSASGRGLHLYVFLEPRIHTRNHSEHAALARAILGQMSAFAGFDFGGRVDICGQNMWVYHRKAKGTDGLSLIKSGIPLDHIPPNWQDHIKVVTGHSKRNLPSFFKDIDAFEASSIQTDAENLFLELTGQSVKIPLDDEHKRLIKWLEENRTQGWWDSDHHMLVTHTFHLKRAHMELNLRGIFETKAAGTETPNDHNCFLFPLRRGAWTVRRYSLGVEEAATWDQDSRGWTRCYYNCDPTLASVARSNGGLESKTGSFVFGEAEQALETVKNLGANIPSLPTGLRTQRASLKEHKDGRIFVEIEGDRNQVAAQDMKGWLHDKGKWTRFFNVTKSAPIETAETFNHDDLIRHLITETNTDYGWAIKDVNGWRMEPLIHISTSLQAMDLSPKEVKTILGSSVIKCWKLVNKPFQPEYPGNREWNRDAAQFRFVPSQNLDSLKFPSWTKILEHCGEGLTEAIEIHPWCKANGIKKGSEYLKIWLASLFREPTEPLPYLFMYGPQNSGKSIFHEAISLLITRGYQRADASLINPQGFNEELKDAILCVVEEINLRKSKDANNRIKDWVTARHMPIHPKGKKPYHVVNTTHWVQCSNDPNACPVFPGDTRITMIYVPEIDPLDMIPKKKLIPMLESEAADFLAELLRLEIPPSDDRLNVPMIATTAKRESENMNRTPLELFLSEKCHYVPGEMMSVAEFYAAFEKWADPNDLAYWTKIRIGRELPQQFPKGRNPADGVHCIGNISFNPAEEGHSRPRLKIQIRNERDAFLVPDGDNN